jgi:hypothetical protein
MNEIIFAVEAAPDGGYAARALSDRRSSTRCYGKALRWLPDRPIRFAERGRLVVDLARLARSTNPGGHS